MLESRASHPAGVEGSCGMDEEASNHFYRGTIKDQEETDEVEAVEEDVDIWLP